MEQKLQLFEEQIHELKAREEGLKNMNNSIMGALNELSKDSNPIGVS